MLCLYPFASRQPLSSEFSLICKRFFVPRTNPSKCNLRWPLAVRSIEMNFFWLVSLIFIFLLIADAGLLVSFCNLSLTCFIFQELNLPKKFLLGYTAFIPNSFVLPRLPQCLLSKSLKFFGRNASIGHLQICKREPFVHQLRFLQCCIWQKNF